MHTKKYRSLPGGSMVKNPPTNAGDMVRSLVREDPTCCGATKPVRYNYWACTLESGNCNYRAQLPQLLQPEP